jgi:hypothetical protein
MRVSPFTSHFSVRQFGRHEWLMNRAIDPITDASITCGYVVT